MSGENMSGEKTAFTYKAEVHRPSDNVGFGRRDVPESYLELGREGVRFLAQRHGIISADESGADDGIRDVDEPIYANPSIGEISGIRMSLHNGQEHVEREFGLDLFQPYFETLASTLLENKQLTPNDKVRLRVFAEPAAVAGDQRGAVDQIRRKPLALRDGQLDAFIAESTPVGPLAESDYSVFVLDGALERALEILWKRNQERGVWLAGNLYRQKAPVHDIFALIHTVFEARGVTHERFSLDLSPETFDHANAQLTLRQRRLGRGGEMILGFYHTHPFLPAVLDGKESCPACPLRSECTLTSSFFSKKDAYQFHIPYFGGAAYAVELVMGLTPREEFDLKMFCLDGGQFRERGYYRLAKLPAAAEE